MASYTESPKEGRDRRSFALGVGFLLLSAVVLYLPRPLQTHIGAGLRASVLRPFLLMQEAIQRERRRGEEATRLQAQLDSLAGVVLSQETLAEENRRLREALGIEGRVRYAFAPALVIRPGTVGSESMFLLDVGEEDGVRAGDPVLMREGGVGLVGVVREVGRKTAIGIDWSHPDFRASAMSADEEVYGLVEPVRGAFREEDRLRLNGVPYYEHLEPGTLIVTSGLGGVYPRGIPIGEVLGIADQDDRWRKAFWLHPVVEVGSLTHALVVLADDLSEELMELLQGGGRPESTDTAGVRGGGEEPTAPEGGG